MRNFQPQTTSISNLPGVETSPCPASRWDGKTRSLFQNQKEPHHPTRSPQASRQAEEKVRDVSLTDNQVDALQDTLLSYPLNLRLAIEDILANAKGTEAQQSV
jgi:hypothetical protein